MRIATLLKQTLNRFGYDIKYHRPFYETIVAPLDVRTILDIGANDGEYARDMAVRFPQATIHAFEPLSECFSRLSQVATTYPNIKPHQTALGTENGTSVIHKSSFHPSSSILPMTALHKQLYPRSAESEDETIAMTRLDDVKEMIEGPMLVKIDVQGFEGAVIEGGMRTLAQASVIVIETSYLTLYEGQPLFIDIATKLQTLGFSYIGSVHTHHSKRTGRPLYEDAAFVKDNILATWANEEARA